MNGQNQQQVMMEALPRYRDLLDEDCLGQSRVISAEGVMQAFSFGPFRLVPSARLLERAGSPIPLSSRAFDLLCLLVSRPGEVVSKGELMAKTWPNITVEETSLRFHITQLRRALGDSQGAAERYVVNVPGRGYCFVACVNREAIGIAQQVPLVLSGLPGGWPRPERAHRRDIEVGTEARQDPAGRHREPIF